MIQTFDALRHIKTTVDVYSILQHNNVHILLYYIILYYIILYYIILYYIILYYYVCIYIYTYTNNNILIYIYLYIYIYSCVPNNYHVLYTCTVAMFVSEVLLALQYAVCLSFYP